VARFPIQFQYINAFVGLCDAVTRKGVAVTVHVTRRKMKQIDSVCHFGWYGHRVFGDRSSIEAVQVALSQSAKWEAQRHRVACLEIALQAAREALAKATGQ
jgi:hypothetical protein